jgi:DNA replication factor GINS
MNLDELRTVQSKERSKDSLQHLRESFYADVADYIADLKDQRERAAEQADSPFDDPEVNRLTDEVNTAEDVVEAIYERRVGKIVKRASLAAAGMPADEEGLTSEEQDLFEELVERIESNKQEVLDILAGEADPHAESPTPPPADDAASGAGAGSVGGTPDPGDPPVGDSSAPGADADDSGEVSAADVMGETDVGASAGSPTTQSSDSAAAGSDGDSDGARPAAAEAAAIADDADADGPDAGSPASGPPDESPPEADLESESSGADDADDPLAGLAERTTIRITDDVGEIFGVDERTYDLASEDVVTLPEANAAPLVERGAAEELE